jgi:hypothetical protein
MEITMSDALETNKPVNATLNTSDDSLDDNDVRSETLIVPPPGFRERLEAAQRARANEIRASVIVPSQLAKLRQTVSDDEPSETPAPDLVEGNTSSTP